MAKICVCGAFCLKGETQGGQAIKTCILTDELKKKYGHIYRIDTIGISNKLKLAFRLFYALCSCKDIIILPAYNGLVIESQLLRWLNIIFRRNLHYSVIGGWLQDYLPLHKHTASALRHFTGIYTETTRMKNALIDLGYTNVYLMPNFKPLNIISSSELRSSFSEPIPLCTFTRVAAMKGIDDAVRAVIELNEELDRDAFSLDIYGPFDAKDEEWFNNLKQSFTKMIVYKGCAPYDKTVEILKGYFAMIFPTKYLTEGNPGTIIDALAAGLPVIASRWMNFDDMIEDGVTGIGYEFGSYEGLKSTILSLIDREDEVVKMRKNCIEKAGDFLPSSVLSVLKLSK